MRTRGRVRGAPRRQRRLNETGRAFGDSFTEDGFAGRFGTGLPRVSDGSLPFLQHMTAKSKSPIPAVSMTSLTS